MKCSIIIPTLNHLEDALKPCLESIVKYTDLTDKEVIVVSNGSTDGTQEYVKSLGDKFRLLDFPDPLGYTKATNEGIKVAKGDFLILLNNDTVLLSQEKDDWIDKLYAPFSNSEVAITGPLMGPSAPAGRDFLIFFCVMIRKSVIDEIGMLDEIFTPGGGEDTDWCIKAENAGYKVVQVPVGAEVGHDGKRATGHFPIYHEGEVTVSELPDWQGIFDRNADILSDRYNPSWKQKHLHNNYERAVVSKDQSFDNLPREYSRYMWASKNLTGKKILELGCSSGYGQRFFPDDIEYTGYDYDKAIIEYAKKEFPKGKYEIVDLEEPLSLGLTLHEDSDTIIAFEVLEHLTNGKELAQELKNYCDTLLITVPYKEPTGLWGPHHKLHQLDETDFPGFEYVWMDGEGKLMSKPNGDVINLMLCKWTHSKVSSQ